MTTTEATLQMLQVSREIGTPILLGVMAAGVGMGLLQAIFQVQEATLGLVARILGLALVLRVMGLPMLERLLEVAANFLLWAGAA